MRILPIIQNCLYKTGNSSYPQDIVAGSGINFCARKHESNKQDTFMHTPQIMSGKKFKKLSVYMTDLYTGEPMLTMEQLDTMRQKQVFNRNIDVVVRRTSHNAKKYLSGIELEIYNKIAQTAKTTPNLTLPELFEDWYIPTRDVFRKKQKPYFDRIKKLGKKLPPDYLKEFQNFMSVTHKKLYDIPIHQKFSSKEFVYQADKILAKKNPSKYKHCLDILLSLLQEPEINSTDNTFSKNVLKRINSVVDLDIPEEKYSKNKDIIKLKLIEKIKNVASSQKDVPLIDLCDQNIKLLHNEAITIPFSNKAFIYDLSKLLENLPDKNLKEQILDVARKLPQSNACAEAFILKNRHSDADTIGYRLFSPSLCTLEHLHLASDGGDKTMRNCALAKMKYNHERSDEPLHLTLQKYNIRAQELYATNLMKLVRRGLVPYDAAVSQLRTIEREGKIKLHYPKK